MEGEIVFKGKTKQGKEYVIRYLKEGDAPGMLDYINTISDERTFISFQGEQLTIAEEEKVLATQREKMVKHEAVMLFVLIDHTIVGISGIEMKDKTEKHEGVFGISLRKEYRGEGIGRRLMQLVLDEAEKHISHLRIVSLGVFGNNKLAMEMYRKFGFVEHGRLPRGVCYKGEFIDHVYMHKSIKERDEPEFL